MKTLWIVVFAACGSTPPPTLPPSNGTTAPELTCKTAVEHAGAVAKLRPKQITMAIGECDQQSWSRQLRECVDGVKDGSELAQCAAKNGVEKRGILAEGNFGEAMKMMTKFKDEICACRDKQCAEKVSDEMTKWSQDQAKTMKEPPRMSEEEVQAATKIGEEMGACMQKAMTP